jgi:ABC-type sugar transport system substrate-binding protein
MKKTLCILAALAMVLSLMTPLAMAEEKKVSKIAFCFQDLETEFWVAGYKAITTTLRAQGIEVLEYNANEDANKQLEQVNDAIAQGVDGIIIIPQDGESAVTIIKYANKAGVPLAVFNRPPSVQSVKAIVVVADNYTISFDAATYMFDQARIRFTATGEKVVAMHMVGDLGDPNAVARADGFRKVAEMNADIVDKIIEVPTKWDANTALANLKSATQANPEFNMLFCGSDFLYPQIQSVLEPLGKWVKYTEANHVITGAVDGDSTAGRLMDEGFVDATAVQDLYFEATACMDALIAAVKSGLTTPAQWIYDPGFALTQGNMAERHNDMWGNK